MSAVAKLDIRKPKRELYQELAAIGEGTAVHAFAPYSDYQVGCAGLLWDGRVVVGVNTENTGIHLTVHGEMSVVNAAIAMGALDEAVEQGLDQYSFIKAVAVTPRRSFEAWPCGHCRDFLSGFGMLMDIIVRQQSGGVLYKPMNRVLPFAPPAQAAMDLTRSGSLMGLVSRQPSGMGVKRPSITSRRKSTAYAELLSHAVDASALSYAPYTKRPAGAAIRLFDDSVYVGARMENVGYTLSLDPELAAIGAAISDGALNRHIAAGGSPLTFLKAVAYAPVGQPNTWPSGSTRQALCDYGTGTDIVVADQQGAPNWKTLGVLLPGAFVPDVLSYWTAAKG